MKTLTLIAAAMALASPARADWKLQACKDACVPPYQSRVVGCRARKTKNIQPCIDRATEKRRQCELECERPAMVPTVPASTAPAVPPPTPPAKP